MPSPRTTARPGALLRAVTRPGAPGHAEVTGQVRAAKADRAPGDASAVTLASGAWFLLECRAEGRSSEVVNVRAARAEAAAGEPPGGLGWTVVAAADDGATLHVAADLQPGAWQIACDAADPGSGRLLRLGPPALVVIE